MSKISRYDACLAAAAAMVGNTDEDLSDSLESLNDYFNDRGAIVTENIVNGQITFTITFPSNLELEDEDEDEDED